MSFQNLPSDLPVPQDDGAGDHFTGQRLPRVILSATDGTRLELAELRGPVFPPDQNAAEVVAYLSAHVVTL